jgi:uncharacterized membrane protein YvbJ
MHCPECQHENREGAKFCEACGSKLELSCPSCGNQIRRGAAFCDHCGTAFTGKKGETENRRIGEPGKRRKIKAEGKKDYSFGLRTSDFGLRTDFG